MKMPSALARDTIQWAAGLGLAVWETVAHQQPRLEVLALALALMGIPAATGLVHLRNGHPRNDSRTGTADSPSPSRSSSSSPSSS